MVTDLETFFEHHGVKGMHWGIRNEATRANKKLARTNKKLAKADKKWQKNIYKMNKSYKGTIAIHNEIANSMNGKVIDDFNKNPKYNDRHTAKTARLHDMAVERYLSDYGKLTEKHADAAVNKLFGSSPSGKFKAEVDHSDDSAWVVKIKEHKVGHANAPELDEVIIELNHDDAGFITSMRQVKPMAEHSSMEEFFEHHGVKGMHWGIRNKSNKRNKTSAEYRTVKAIRKKRPPRLTNKQLQTHNTRMNLERQYHKLNPSKVAQGRNAAKGILGTVTAAGTLYTLFNSPFGKAAMARGRKFANVATDTSSDKSSKYALSVLEKLQKVKR